MRGRRDSNSQGISSSCPLCSCLLCLPFALQPAFLQADKLDEGVNGRYFINPPPGSPEAGNKDIVCEVLKPLYGSPSSPRALYKTMDAYFKSEGFDTIGFEEAP